MIHAKASALVRLESLLMRLCAFTELKEKTPGIFYRKSKAFLHFHEDAENLFADISIAGSWTRFSVDTLDEYDRLIEVVKKQIGAHGNVQRSTEKRSTK